MLWIPYGIPMKYIYDLGYPKCLKKLLENGICTSEFN